MRLPRFVAPVAAMLAATILLLVVTSLPARAQFFLTGSTMYAADATGAWTGGFWNTQGPDWAFNMYLFTAPTASPTFLNSGNTNATLNPNYLLTPGTHVINFAGESPQGSFLGINLYFNNEATNRITAYAPNNG